MKVKTFKQHMNEDHIDNLHPNTPEKNFVVDTSELQSKVDKLSDAELMVLHDDFDFLNVNNLSAMNAEDLDSLNYIIDTYFLTSVDDVLNIVKSMDKTDIDDLGYYLDSTLFDSESDDEIQDSYTLDDVVEMVVSLCDEPYFVGVLMDLVSNGIEEDYEYDPKDNPKDKVLDDSKKDDSKKDDSKKDDSKKDDSKKDDSKKDDSKKDDSKKDDSEKDKVLDEVSRIMKTKDMNHKKRKFMTKSGATMRREKSTRKRSNRVNKSKKKRYYKANKNKISAYQKSRNTAIKKGKHKVKMRRKA